MMLLENWISLISGAIMLLLIGTMVGTVILYGQYKNQKSKPHPAVEPALATAVPASPAPIERRRIAIG